LDARGDHIPKLIALAREDISKAVLSGAKVIERVLVDNLTETAAYKREYDTLRE
jgi:hypothetical protein